MSTKVISAAVIGLEAQPIEVEADVSRGLVKFFIVGLPDTAVQEARERVRSGIKNSGFDFPSGTITINLAPADMKKEGPRFDVPIAVAVLLSQGYINPQSLNNKSLILGELSLDGATRPVSGMLSVAILAKRLGFSTLYVPSANAAEAGLVPGLRIFPVGNLSQLVEHLNKHKRIQRYQSGRPPTAVPIISQHDLQYVRGQEQAKRALEIAASGGHNVLMTGPPGSGKTLLARSLATILPAMTLEESLQVTQIYSVAGLVANDAPLIRQRPFRAPHHTTSSVALVGGGSFPRPGEISLAHRGVLFLDELPEYSRAVLESLRQPLEDGVVTVARAAGSVRFPANFTLIAARNPCPCGYLNDEQHECTCSPHQVAKYQKRISGPLLDRIDMHITVPRIPYEKLSDYHLGETSAVVSKRVDLARGIQTTRFKSVSSVNNAELSLRQLDKWCQLVRPAQILLKRAVNQFSLSARAYHRIIKVSRTIADLSGADDITAEHLAEALQYRPQAE